MSEQMHGVSAPMARRMVTTSGDLVSLLEERVSGLVHRQQEARRTIQDLRTQLKEREKRIGELNEKVYGLGRVKTEVAKRVERLIAEIEQLERKHTPAEPRA